MAQPTEPAAKPNGSWHERLERGGTIASGHYSQALDLLAPLGQVWRSDFFNVLTLTALDVGQLLETLRQTLAADPVAAAVIGKAIPASHVFRFDNAEQFLPQAGELLTTLAPRLAGRSSHVRLHRRGFKGRIHTPESEQSLDKLVVEATSRLGRPARISFSDPEVIVALETVGNQAGLSLWNREERLKYPFLRLD